jgi:RHS repeat-associated protein
MPNRTFSLSSKGYRFGFNGKELENDLYGSGNAYDFGARINDTRIGRWLSVDPLQSKYPFASPYNYALNTPIQAIDPDGKRVYFVAGAGNDVDGWNYVNRFKTAYTNNGIQGFTRLNVSGGQLMDMAYSNSELRNKSFYGHEFDKRSGEVVLKRFENKQILRAVNGIVADLQKRPLKEGEQLNLSGYSYGSVLQAQVALRLADKGIKVDNLILVGSPISDQSELYKSLTSNPNIKNVIRQDIPNDEFSNPKSSLNMLGGAQQASPKFLGGQGDDAPHFDLARPGAEADKKIDESAKELKSKGVE